MLNGILLIVVMLNVVGAVNPAISGIFVPFPAVFKQNI
jgi:hypothetical protein